MIQPDKYVTAPVSEWRLPEDDPPPPGQMVQLLSVYGKAVHACGIIQGFG